MESLFKKTLPHTKFYLVHQLDYVTSGIQIWGLNSKATGRAGKQFQLRTVEKVYLAVIRGWCEDHHVIEKNIVEVGKEMRIGTAENPGRVRITRL